jgi:ferredoxin
LRIRQQEQQTFYFVDPELCDGCGLCVELCEVGAINMASGDHPARPQIVNLFAARCQRCGTSFHLPRNTSEAPPLCRICAARTP